MLDIDLIDGVEVKAYNTYGTYHSAVTACKNIGKVLYEPKSASQWNQMIQVGNKRGIYCSMWFPIQDYKSEGSVTWETKGSKFFHFFLFNQLIKFVFCVLCSALKRTKCYYKLTFLHFYASK